MTAFKEEYKCKCGKVFYFKSGNTELCSKCRTDDINAMEKKLNPYFEAERLKNIELAKKWRESKIIVVPKPEPKQKNKRKKL